MQCLARTGLQTPRTSKRHFQTVAARDAIKAQASNVGVFIDLRHPSCTKEMAPLGFRQIPHYALNRAVGQGTLSRDQPVYLADTWGLTHSEEAARLLERMGFTKVNIIAGGVVSWGSSGGPISPSCNVAEIEKKYNYKFNNEQA